MEWSALAACKHEDIDIFFPHQNQSDGQAKEICAGCMVRAQCLDVAVKDPLLKGIWGGTSERERMRIRRQYIRDDVKRERAALAARFGHMG